MLLLALCRRATVYKNLENYKKAIIDIDVVLKKEPTNKTALVSLILSFVCL